jgi:NADH dehydrogenase FAD-containing subunit
VLTSDHQRVVVVGSSFAGLTAALELRKHLRGPQAHWAKLAFERYFLASRKRGLVAF